MLYLTIQHKLGILQRLVVEKPVQFCPLCRSVAVLVLNGGAVDGNDNPKISHSRTFYYT